jgi:ABC-type nitrate/sulfonate/bicarbonate transport system permease component
MTAVQPAATATVVRGAVDSARKLIGLVALLALWELSSRLELVSPFLLPSVSDIVVRIFDDAMAGELASALGSTLVRTLSGFALAAVLGVVIGTAMARNRFVMWLLDPLISVAFPIPKIVFLPIFMLWLGVQESSKITMIVIDSIVPIITAAQVGVLTVDRHLVWSGSSIGMSSRRLLWSVYLPAAAPTILTGLQIALPISLIVAIVCEMLMGGYGVGGLMINASRFSDVTGVFAGLFETSAVGFVLIRSMAAVRARILNWSAENQSHS